MVGYERGSYPQMAQNFGFMSCHSARFIVCSNLLDIFYLFLLCIPINPFECPFHCHLPSPSVSRMPCLEERIDGKRGTLHELGKCLGLRQRRGLFRREMYGFRMACLLLLIPFSNHTWLDKSTLSIHFNPCSIHLYKSIHQSTLIHLNPWNLWYDDVSPLKILKTSSCGDGLRNQDPTIERIVTPRLALTTAEYFACAARCVAWCRRSKQGRWWIDYDQYGGFLKWGYPKS